MRSLGFICIVGFVLIAVFWPGGEGRRPPGVLVPEEPTQVSIPQPRPWQVKDYRVTPLALYHIRARVLLTEPYWFGRESDLSPLDLTVGWRLMSNQEVLDGLRLYSLHRAYMWTERNNRMPAKEEDIITHSANMHLIPANPDVGSALKSLRRGDLVELNGYLVQVDAPDGWHWRSSLTRTDTGNGACELMWVDSAATF